VRAGGTPIIALDPAGFRRLKRLFDLAADLPPEARDDLVRTMCGDDPAVRAQLELLIESEVAEELVERLRRRIARMLGGTDWPGAKK